MTRLDDIYIAYGISNDIKTGNLDIQLPIKAIVDFMADDFPDYVLQYKEYLRRKSENSEDNRYPLWAFEFITFDGDEWTLKFVDGKLVSRRIKNAVPGCDRIEYID